jgi:predicted enzyme related to lactoylglutathione lyase
MKTHFIIYVEDLSKTKLFYELLFNINPIIDDPGMCEYQLPDGTLLGIMPSTSLEKLFGKSFEKQKNRKALPQTELYFLVEDAKQFHKRAIQLGASEIREFSEMDWGDSAAYSINHDGHILAFAEKTTQPD